MADSSNLWSISTLLGFLLTLMRIGGVFVFVPLPGFKSAVDVARVFLIAGVTVALFPVWPHPAPDTPAGLFVLWMISEAALGIGIGLAVTFALEAFVVGAQLIGIQAGFSFASTVDPFTTADSPVLIVMAQTAAALLFFASGLDREVLKIFAQSLVTYPPGTFILTKKATDLVLLAGSTMFSVGLRLALPVIAAMLMVDISLSLLGRINSHLQLHTISFSVKMVLSLILLSWVVVLFPALLRGGAGITLAVARTLITR